MRSAFFFSWLFAGLVFTSSLNAQNIEVLPLKDFLLSDSIHARFGDAYVENDPLGRRAFAQWIVKDAALTGIELKESVLFSAEFVVDQKGLCRKVDVLKKGNSKAAKLLATAIEESPRWKSYRQNGVNVTTLERISLVLLPPKTPGGEIRCASTVLPTYPDDGIVGFLAWLKEQVEDKDWRSDFAKSLRKRQTVEAIFTIQVDGRLNVALSGCTDKRLCESLSKRLSKGKKWQAGIYQTRLCPYSFRYSIDLKPWNEKSEGEKVNRSSMQNKTQYQLDQERRYRDRQQQR